MGAKTELFVRKQKGGMFAVVREDLTTGNIFFVHSGTGTDGAGYGRNPDSPFATLDYAIGQCTANQGDRIYVMPGHSEDVDAAAAVDVDVAGVSIIGIGHGADRPTFDLSAVASTFEIGAASVHLENLLFTVSEDATIVLDVNAADAYIKNCEFRNAAAKEAVTFIDINGGAANACDRAVVDGCVFRAPNAGTDTAIGLDEVADGVVVKNCWAFGAFGDAAIHNPAAKVLTLLTIVDNVLVNTTAASHSIELVSACTGLIAFNRCGSPLADATPGDIDGGACHILENYSHDAGGNDSGLLNPSADS